MTNASSNESFISVCCILDDLDPDDSFCYRNGTFPVWEIFKTVVSNFSIAFVPSILEEPICSEGKMIDLKNYPPNNDVFYLREDGAINIVKSIEDRVTGYELHIPDYCFTSHLTENGRKGAISFCASFGFLIGHLSSRIAAGLSMPFLAATFFVYTILPELNNVSGFIVRAYVTSLFVAWTLFFTHNASHPSVCTYIIVPMYFSTMSYYIWVTVMSFDIWWTFRQARSSRSQSKQENRKKCITYSITAWGSSAFITGVVAILEFVPTVAEGVIRPGLRDSCESYRRVPYKIYWIVPMGLTFICDICFFMLTAITLIRHEKDTVHRLHESDEQSYAYRKKRFYLHLKLFLIMGITYLADVINVLWQDEIPEYIKALLDLPSSLQGINIFIIFVFKKKIKKLLLKRFGCKVKAVPQTVELEPSN